MSGDALKFDSTLALGIALVAPRSSAGAATGGPGGGWGLGGGVSHPATATRRRTASPLACIARSSLRQNRERHNRFPYGYIGAAVASEQIVGAPSEIGYRHVGAQFRQTVQSGIGRGHRRQSASNRGRRRGRAQYRARGLQGPHHAG